VNFVSQLVEPVVEARGMLDVALLGLGVKAIDLMMAPMFGDNNLMSGLAKGAVGVGLYNFGGGSLMKIGGSAGIVAGISDIIDVTVWPIIGSAIGAGQTQGEGW